MSLQPLSTPSPRTAPARSARAAESPAPGGVIAALYARGLLDYLRSRDVDPASLYPPARVAELDTARGHTEIPLPEWIAMFDIAIAALGEPDLPLKAGASLRMRHLGVLGHVLMNCATLEEVSAQLARYIRLLGQIGQPVLSVQGERAHLLWSWPYDTAPVDTVAQFMLGARAMFMRWLSNRPDLRFDGCFHFARPRELSSYERIFGGRLLFDQPQSKMVFPAEYMRLPVVSADEDLRQQVEAQAQAALRELSDESELLRRLKTVLANRLAGGGVTVAETAAALDLAPRTLQRRLAEQSRSYQTVVDEVRCARAEQLLRDPSVSLTQVAFMLGYTEQSTFHNAFKRWTGVPPGVWRRCARPPAQVGSGPDRRQPEPG